MAGRRRNVNIGANSIVYSGRGRPRTKEIVDRPLPVGIVLGSPSPGSDIFKNRKIRVGGLFQAKVPKKPSVEKGVNNNSTDDGQQQGPIYRSSRKPPSRVSAVYPHLTRDEVEEYETKVEQHKEYDNAPPSQTPSEVGLSTTAMELDAAPSSQQARPDNNTFIADSSNSIVSNTSGSQKTSTTDRQGSCSNHSNSNNNNSNNDQDESVEGPYNEDGDDDDEEELKTERGGLLLCASSAAFSTPTSATTTTTEKSATTTDNQDAFWDYVQPLLLPNEGPYSTNSAVEGSNVEENEYRTPADTWQSKVLQWHLDKQQRALQLLEMKKKQEEEANQNLPKRRGRKKRKVEEPAQTTTESEESALEWYDHNILASQSNKGETTTTTQQPQKRQRTSMTDMEESKAHAMQHFWLRHKGQLAIAELETRVQLSAGKAEEARKVRAYKRRKETRVNLSEVLWRSCCEQSTISAMTGDYRNNGGSAAQTAQRARTNEIRAGITTDSDVVEVQKETWKAILDLGKAIVEHLIKASSNTGDNVPFPKFSLLLSFLENANHVRPLPEDIFRAPSMVPEINQCFNQIAEHAVTARKVQAQLMDALFETNHSGIDLDAVQKLLDQQAVKALPVELDDASELRRHLALDADWQTRLDTLVGESELCLSGLENLAQEGRSFSFRSKSLVCLENRIQKAYQLRDRIVQWRKACEQSEENLDDQKESVKFLAAMVRDANRLKLQFPEVSDLLETHRTVEAWIDRANIAIRSRISLKEIKALIQTGEEQPVNLSDFLEKLRARVGLAEEWVTSFEEVVPRTTDSDGVVDPDSDKALLRWMGGMRNALKEGNHTLLHDLASAGSRIPVEVDIVKLLQIELDGKTWTVKAKKWVPRLADEEGIACKKGKLEDLREHLDKASLLRERLDLAPSERSEWVLEGEREIRSIVQAADDWFEKYKPFLDWDNRRTEGRSCLSMKTLRTIVDEGNSIHANVGSATGKMARILAQAEEWEQKHQSLLLTCNIIAQGDGVATPQSTSYVTLDSMTAAAEAAAADVSLDLDEAKELIKIVERVKDWYSRATNAAPKRSKRQSRGRKAKLTVEDIIGLIKEASILPVDTSDVVNRLQMQLSAVQEWRAKAREELENIYNGFLKLRHVADEMYGHPQEYTRKVNEKADNSGNETRAESDSGEEKKVTEDMSNCETSSITGSEQDSEGMSHLGNGTCNVNQLIKLYRREALTYGVLSGEVEAAEQLDKVSNWCVRSLKYLVTQRDVFDKRFFGAFDRFVAEGRELLTPPSDDAVGEYIRLDDHSLAEKLNASWSAFVSDQLQRLEVLLADREQFMSWCNAADELLGAKDKPSLEKLKELTDDSRGFPSVCDMVQKVRGIFNKAMEWKRSTGRLLEEGTRLSRNEAKIILDEGEKLGFVCEEMKVLRDALRLARNWANKVKRYSGDNGSANSNTVQGLIAEHEKLLIEMPEELSTLQEAMQLYCICRRPYSGFMIGCDECEEWYHGACIGISESKAERVEKFVCVRCCVSRVYKSTAKEAVSVVKKWTCQKNMKKARKVDEQKHLRKVRKETKEIEKLRAEIKSLESPPQESPPNGVVAMASSSQTGVAGDSETPVTSNPQDSGKPDTTQDAGKAANATDPNKPESDKKDEPKPAQPKLSPEEVTAKVESAQETIRKCNDRLVSLNELAEKQKAILSMEDSKAPLLRNWCLRVRSLVLVPRSDDAAILCRPLENGSLSTVMQNLMHNAKELELSSLADVKAMDNAFRCLAWCLLAASTLARKPSMKEIDLLVSRAKSLKFTEEKALRVIKGIHSRGKSWQGKVLKTLAPSPGEKKPFNLDALKELESSAHEVPVRFKEMSLISSVIADKGARHCLCGGPSDARFMLGCDKCEEWFHGRCVSMTKEQCDEVQNKKWICPRCARRPGEPSHVVDVASCGIVWEEVDDPASSEKATRNLDVASEAPDAAKMWPPFGLFGTPEALEVLGDECSAIPDAEEIVKKPNGGAHEVVDVPSHIPVVTEDGQTVAVELPTVPSAPPEGQPPTQGCQSSSTDAGKAQCTTLKSCVDLPFQWLAQSGDLSQLNAAAMAAAQSMAQSNPPVFTWPQNAIVSMGAVGSLNNPPSKSEGGVDSSNSNPQAKSVESFNEGANENIKPSANGCQEVNVVEASVPLFAQVECVPPPPVQMDCDSQPHSTEAKSQDPCTSSVKDDWEKADSLPLDTTAACIQAEATASDGQDRCHSIEHVVPKNEVPQPTTEGSLPETQGHCPSIEHAVTETMEASLPETQQNRVEASTPPSAQEDCVPPPTVDFDSQPHSSTEAKPQDACTSSVKDNEVPPPTTEEALPETQSHSHNIDQVVPPLPPTTEENLPETQRAPSPAPMPTGLSLMVAALPVHEGGS